MTTYRIISAVQEGEQGWPTTADGITGARS